MSGARDEALRWLGALVSAGWSPGAGIRRSGRPRPTRAGSANAGDAVNAPQGAGLPTQIARADPVPRPRRDARQTGRRPLGPRSPSRCGSIGRALACRTLPLSRAHSAARTATDAGAERMAPPGLFVARHRTNDARIPVAGGIPSQTLRTMALSLNHSWSECLPDDRPAIDPRRSDHRRTTDADALHAAPRQDAAVPCSWPCSLCWRRRGRQPWSCRTCGSGH